MAVRTFHFLHLCHDFAKFPAKQSRPFTQSNRISLGTKTAVRQEIHNRIRGIIRRFVAVALWSYQTTLLAQGADLHFENISLEQGLPQSVVLDVIQDRGGLMWFGTQAGLVSFDGYDFRQFKHNPDDSSSISDDYIWTIYEDSQGFIWVRGSRRLLELITSFNCAPSEFAGQTRGSDFDAIRA